MIADIRTKKIIILLFVFSTVLCWTTLSSVMGSGKCRPTENDIEGPYYVPGVPFRSEIAGPHEQGEPIVIQGRVMHSDCRTPVKEALIEVWQTDAGGNYHYSDKGFRLRGQMKTDAKGNYEFRSIKPGRYGIMEGFRPEHIHFRVSHRDYRTLVTQLYFEGDPYLWPKDACGSGCKSNDPNRTIALSNKRGILEGTFTIILKPVQRQ